MMPKKFLHYLPLIAILLMIPFLDSCSKAESREEIQTEEGYKLVNGTDLFYKRMGAGEPIMVVHGGPVLEHGYLVPFFKPLTENYELIYFDQRLSGRSTAEVDSAEVTLDNFVEDIEELRKALNIDKMHLMAHSWGGLLAMKYAIKYPTNLNSLILLNSMPASSDLWMQEEGMLAQQISEEDSLKRQEIMTSDLFQNDPSKAIEQLLVLSFRNQFATPSLADSLDFYIPDDYMVRSQRFGNLMGDISNYDLHSELEAVDVPTLLMYGDIEPAASISGPELQSAIPNAEFVVLENSGHFPFVEQPELFMNELNSFLESSH